MPVLMMATCLLASRSGAQVAQSWSERVAAGQERLVVEVFNATVRVIGGDGDSVRFTVRGVSPKAVALRPPTFTASEVRLSARDNPHAVEVVVSVPRHFDVELRGSNGGVYSVEGVHGDIDVDNSNAGIRIDGARQSVLAATSNGPIVLRSVAVPVEALISLITSNDSVSVTLPANANLTINLETDNGRVVSEFSRAAVPPGPPAGNARVLRGTIGSGGASLRVRTDNGMIWLRRRQ